MTQWETHDEMTYSQEIEKKRLETESNERIAKIKAEADVKIARANRSRNRQTTYQVVGCSALAASVILGIVTAVYLGNRGPDTPDQDSEPARERQCIEAGGGWVPKDLFDLSEHGLCVFPGKSVPEQVPSNG